jgi:hypothetical protein
VLFNFNLIFYYLSTSSLTEGFFVTDNKVTAIPVKVKKVVGISTIPALLASDSRRILELLSLNLQLTV